MGAATHLGIKPGAYDRTIATLIPHYGELLDAAASAVDVMARTAPAVVDLGTGSGALAQRISAVRPKARLIGVDADASMLDAATRRLRGHIQVVEEDFEHVRIPRCDVVSASFALHHVPTGRRKAAVYKRCFAALRPGGMFVSADCYLAASAQLQKRHRGVWLEHLKRNYSSKKAETFLRTWAREDVYFTLDREIELLKDAGFATEVTWRKDCFAVLVGLR
ncbi:MAG TPA: class I SAM-dependent methyltransferase [Vicinamibacterales bacterium]|nr:class I SAM-dependent methyltransferase [Vicinamibacterales bacterium]